MLYCQLAEKLKEEKKELEYQVLQGRLSDYASYRFFIGKIDGLQGAIERCQDLFKGETSNDN
jgi:hypothetical protein